MATKKIRELTQATSANDTDVMIIEDAVDTKYITFANLITGIKNKITSVASLATARHIDGMSFNGTADIAHRASCTTAATTVAKTAALSDYALKTGGWVAVNFSSGNTAAAATLNVNSTGAKAIYYKGAAVPAGYIAAGATVLLVYNGTQYDIIGELCQSQIDSLNSNFQTEGASMQSRINALDVSLTGLAGRSSYVKTVGIDAGKVSNMGFITNVGRFTVMIVGNAGGNGTIFLLIPLNTASSSITTIGSVMTVTGITSLGSQGGFTASLIREGADLYRLKIYGYPALLGSVVTFYAPESVAIQYASQADA